jgi:predicted Zn finger-like uncharacterized protein
MTEAPVTLTCPACDARFKVPGKALLPKGRKVRCSKCGHSWFQEPLEDRQEKGPSVSEADDGGDSDNLLGSIEQEKLITVEDLQSQEALQKTEKTDSDEDDHLVDDDLSIPDLVRPYHRQQKDTKGSKSKSLPKISFKSLQVYWPWFAAFGSILALFLFLILGRGIIIAIWPYAGRYYQLAGADTLIPGGAGVLIDKVSPREEVQNGRIVLIIRGMLVNTREEPVRLPKLQAELYQGDTVLKEWMFTADAKELQPEETTSFETQVVEDYAGATRVVVTFSKEYPEDEQDNKEE